MFYVYEHIRNDTNAIFYVGKGKKERAYRVNNRNEYWKNIVNKTGYTVRFVVKDVDEELAYLVEEERIDQLKRLGIKLTNLTLGGEGASGGENHHMWGKTHPDKGSKRPYGKYKRGTDNPMYGKPSAMRGKKNIGASLAHKGRKRPEGGGKPSKGVIATDKDGNKLTFVSLTEAGKFIKSDRHSIKEWCEMNKFCKNYKWEFAKCLYQ
jgi:hypothetical protein